MAAIALRMEQAARTGSKGGGYDYFTTTLTISPLKNAVKINEIGEELRRDLSGISICRQTLRRRTDINGPSNCPENMDCTGRITADVYSPEESREGRDFPNWIV